VSLRERLFDVLRKYSAENSDIVAIGVMTIQGLPLISAYPKNIEEGVVSAMASAIFSVARRLISNFNIQNAMYILIKTKETLFIIKTLTSNYLLLINIKSKAPTGEVFSLLEKLSDDLVAVFKASNESYV